MGIDKKEINQDIIKAAKLVLVRKDNMAEEPYYTCNKIAENSHVTYAEVCKVLDTLAKDFCKEHDIYWTSAFLTYWIQDPYSLNLHYWRVIWLNYIINRLTLENSL